MTQPPYVVNPYAVPASNGMATAALVLGIVGFVFALIPLFGIFIAAPCALLAFIFGIVGLVKAPKAHKGMGLAVAGLVLSIVIGIMMTVGGGWLW